LFKKYLLLSCRCGRKSFIRKGHLSPADIELAQKGFAAAKDAGFSGKYDMVILDEINVAVDFQLIPLASVLDLIKNKPENLYLGLTGRNAPPEIIELADLVTEMKEIKHPFTKGIPAQEGFEY
jgi:cob(I)alamin adenosyltransferase